MSDHDDPPAAAAAKNDPAAPQPYEAPRIEWEHLFVALMVVSDPNICNVPNPPPQCQE